MLDDGNHLPTMLLLGCVYFVLKDYEKALETFESIISIDSDAVRALTDTREGSNHATFLGGSHIQQGPCSLRLRSRD